MGIVTVEEATMMALSCQLEAVERTQTDPAIAGLTWTAGVETYFPTINRICPECAAGAGMSATPVGEPAPTYGEPNMPSRRSARSSRRRWFGRPVALGYRVRRRS
jgi:hypothetical protein